MLYSIGTATIITSVPILSTSLDIVEPEDLLLPKIGVVVLAVTEILSRSRLWRSAPISIGGSDYGDETKLLR